MKKQFLLTIIKVGTPILMFTTPLTLMNACSSEPIASTIYGRVRGTSSNEIYSFKGVPYAKTPVGDLKFAPPHNPDTWQGTKDCTKYGDACIQDDQGSGWTIQPQGDDCLNLNIWTPTLQPKNLPVYVYIHGGVFTIGSSHQDVFDGQNLAFDQGKRDIVVVTINYRLHALGFMALNALEQNALNDLDQPIPDGHGDYIKTNGNWGVLDQIKALQWVHKNIKYFGGNPDNVTVAGESAGSFSVSCLIVSPATDPKIQSDGKPLFQHAVMESGNLIGFDAISTVTKGWLTNPNYNPDTNPEHPGAIQVCEDLIQEKLFLSDSSTDLKALRAVPSEWLAEYTKIIWMPEVVPDIHTYNFIPSYDGWALPYCAGNWAESELYAIENGAFRNVDILWGWNTGEGYGLVPGGTAESLGIGLDIFNQAIEDRIINMKGESIDPTQYDGQMSIGTDTNFDKAIRDLIKYAAFSSSTLAFMSRIESYCNNRQIELKQHFVYNFNYIFDYPTDYGNTISDGAAHTAELPFIFGNHLENGLPQDLDVSKTMMTYWTNFAKTGNVNSSGLTNWDPRFDLQKVMQFYGVTPKRGSTSVPFTYGMQTPVDWSKIKWLADFYQAEP